MRGREVYKVAVRLLPRWCRGADSGGLQAADVTQSSRISQLRIIESGWRRSASAGKMLDQHRPLWHTSSASMPITLDEANRAGRLKKGDVIAMMAIGAA